MRSALFKEHRIITIRYRRVMAIQDFYKAINDGKGPCSAGDFLVMVAERIADRMGDIIADLDESNEIVSEFNGLR